MKNIFSITKNVQKFMDVAEKVTSRDTGIPCMGLIYGKPGLGKTRTAIWYTVRDSVDAVYIRCKSFWTVHRMFEEVITELGIAPARGNGSMFDQIKEQLRMRQPLIIFDEVDHLNGQLIESIRDIHDETENPILLIGMQSVNLKLKRYAHFSSRLLEIQEFETFSTMDVEAISKDLLESCQLNNESAKMISDFTNGELRRVIVSLFHIDRMAKRSNIKIVEPEHILQLNGKAKRKVL